MREFSNIEHILSYTRKAVEEYDMIQSGDKIAVGVSGGKDSVALLAAMADLRRFYPAKFELVAITLDPRFGGEDADYSEIEELCRKLGLEYG